MPLKILPARPFRKSNLIVALVGVALLFLPTSLVAGADPLIVLLIYIGKLVGLFLIFGASFSHWMRRIAILHDRILIIPAPGSAGLLEKGIANSTYFLTTDFGFPHVYIVLEDIESITLEKDSGKIERLSNMPRVPMAKSVTTKGFGRRRYYFPHLTAYVRKLASEVPGFSTGGSWIKAYLESYFFDEQYRENTLRLRLKSLKVHQKAMEWRAPFCPDHFAPELTPNFGNLEIFLTVQDPEGVIEQIQSRRSSPNALMD
jgi:hypothetical protein